MSKAKITPRNVLGFVQGWSRKLFGIDMPQHIEEQVQWRLTLLKEECKGECQHCHCPFPAKAFEDRGCEHPTDPCYGPLLDKDQWQVIKDYLNKQKE